MEHYKTTYIVAKERGTSQGIIDIMEHYKTTYIVAKERGTSQGIIDIKASAHD
jgi:hypothetical protein